MVEHWPDDRKILGTNTTRLLRNMGNIFYTILPMSFGGDTILSAVIQFYVVSMPGEVKTLHYRDICNVLWAV